MNFESPEVMFLLYVGIFIGIILAFEGVRQLLSGKEDPRDARNRRMRMLKAGASNEEVLSILLEESAGRKRGFTLVPDLKKALRQAGMPYSPIWLFLVMVALGVGAYFFLLGYVQPLYAAAGGVVSGIVLPLAFLSGRRGERLKHLNKQLPDALDLMARGLKVGHPLNVTIASVAQEMPDPIGTEFGIIQSQVEFGDELVDAMNDFAERVDLEDARYLAVSIGIQHGTGGNLARVLNVLSKVIRDRSTMQKRIKAISAEGRLSAVILTALPFIILASILTTSPGFYTDVYDDPLFIKFAIAIATLILAQGYILNRLVSFKF